MSSFVLNLFALATALISFADSDISTGTGTQGTLLPVEGDEVAAVGTVPGLVDYYDYNTLAPFNPSLFQLTTQEGDVYVIDEHEGLKSLADRNGNTLTIAANGIIRAGSGTCWVMSYRGQSSSSLAPTVIAQLGYGAALPFIACHKIRLSTSSGQASTFAKFNRADV